MGDADSESLPDSDTPSGPNSWPSEEESVSSTEPAGSGPGSVGSVITPSVAAAAKPSCRPDFVVPEPAGSGSGPVVFFIARSVAPAAQPSCRPAQPSVNLKPEAAARERERESKRELYLRGWWYLHGLDKIAKRMQEDCADHERMLKRHRVDIQDTREALEELLAAYSGDTAGDGDRDEPGADEDEGDPIPDGPDFGAPCHS